MNHHRLIRAVSALWLCAPYLHAHAGSAAAPHITGSLLSLNLEVSGVVTVGVESGVQFAGAGAAGAKGAGRAESAT